MLSLSALKQHVKSRNSITLIELSLLLREDDKTIQYMMQHFIDKGQVKQCALTSKCGTLCKQCQPNQTIIYQWITREH